jgi:methyl-accepting chemotaxis protein
VVASEVRHLASRSSSAAKDIRHLIDDSVGMVHSSLQQAHDVGNTVRQVQQAIASVSEIVDAISTGSQDQRHRAEHIDTTIAQMDQSTQQNAALVEQVAAAAHSLEAQSERLTHAVSAFRVSHVQTSQPPLLLPLQQATIHFPVHA